VPDEHLEPDDLAGPASTVAALADPARRALYRYVAAQEAPVSRDQAATELAVPLHSVKFHLDRLVEAGLLEVEFRRLSGRTGPGAGRPSKLYRRSSRQVSVSLPARHYELAGDILAEAIDRSVTDGTPVLDAVRTAATQVGGRLAAEALAAGDAADGRTDDDPDARPPIGSVAAVLSRHGYEPRLVDDDLCLANCPFDRLATDHTDLVCAMNLALVGGVVAGLAGRPPLTARLSPTPGRCCVTVGH
jgi:predicted ArsR family transcriptional regulator